MRVLTVDDQPFFRAAARRVVEATDGFEWAGEASSGAEAAERMDDGAADLVVLGARLPDGDTIESARRLLHDHPRAAVRPGVGRPAGDPGRRPAALGRARDRAQARLRPGAAAAPGHASGVGHPALNGGPAPGRRCDLEPAPDGGDPVLHVGHPAAAAGARRSRARVADLEREAARLAPQRDLHGGVRAAACLIAFWSAFAHVK